MTKNIESEVDEVLNEQVKEIVEEPEPIEELDEERTVNTSDFGNQDEDDFKPQEVEEMIDREEEKRGQEE